MIRSIFRLLAAIALAVAVILAVLDAARSIAADAVILTPLGKAWAEAMPSSLVAVEQWFGGLPAFLWDPLMVFVLGLPGFVVFAGLSLILRVIGQRPRNRRRSFAMEG